MAQELEVLLTSILPELGHLPVIEQARLLIRTSKRLRSLSVEQENSEHWRLLVEHLCRESHLWLPSSAEERELLAGGRRGWQGLFRELWPLRARFKALAPAGDAQEAPNTQEAFRFRLETCCRFRPPSKWATGSAQSNGRAALPLPLHQRVALLKRSHPELSQREAVQRVIEAQRAVTEHAASDEASKGRDDGFSASILSITGGAGGSVLTVSPGCGLRSFDFGHVFDSGSSQKEVFAHCGLRLVADLVNGVNGALVLYGQTGSGKTYTMFGPQSASPEDQGLASRVAEAALASAEERRAAGFEVKVSLSYVEVFGNEVVDLLGDVRAPHHRAANERVGHRKLLEGAMETPLENLGHLQEILNLGDSRKRQATTAMNERSTRAHTLLVLHMQQAHEHFGPDVSISSKLFLADLGGSERVTKSQANEDAKAAGFSSWEEYYSSRRRLTEANYINQGLLALKRCIRALDERQRKLQAGRNPPTVPFRDSKLTSVLEPAFGGLARTAVIVCCSPDEIQAEETVQTLRFGEMCSKIEHVQKATSDPTNAVGKALRQLDEEILEVEDLIRQKERWEWRETVRKDLVDASTAATSKMNAAEVMELGGLGAVEILPASADEIQQEEVQHVVRGQVLVGAEEERERLEALLDRRRKLLGEA